MESAGEEALRFIQKLVDFFTNDYLDILESAQYHVVYHFDERWPKLTGVAEAELDEAEQAAEADAEIVEDESDSEDEDEDDEEIEVDESGAVRTRELSPEDIAAAEAASIAAGAVAGGAAGAIAGGAVVGGTVTGGTMSGGTLGKGSSTSVAGSKPSYSAVAKAKAKAKGECAPRVIKQGTVTRTAEGKAILTKRNGTVVPYVSKAAAVKEVTEKSHCHGFDHISAVSQASLNAWFKSLWTASSISKSTTDSLLCRFTYEQYFSTSFQAPTIRLLSDNKVIIWIHLQDGWLKTLKNWSPWSE